MKSCSFMSGIATKNNLWQQATSLVSCSVGNTNKIEFLDNFGWYDQRTDYAWASVCQTNRKVFILVLCWSSQ